MTFPCLSCSGVQSRRRMRVLLHVFCALTVSGCYLSHRIEDTEPADAGPPVDAGPLACAPVPLDDIAAICRSGSDRRSYTFLLEPCTCGAVASCELLEYRSEGRPDLANFSLELCGRECASCEPNTPVACEVPNGDAHKILVDDVEAAIVDRPPSRGATCTTPGTGPRSGCDFPGGPISPDRVCVALLDGTSRTIEEGDQLAIDVEMDVSCMLEPGPCEVLLDRERGELELVFRLRACGPSAPNWDCTGERGTLRRRCISPPLPGRSGGWDVVAGLDAATGLAVVTTIVPGETELDGPICRDRS